MFLVFNTCFSFFLMFCLFFFFFVMLNLLFEKLKSCPIAVDVRMVLCLVELMNC